MQELWFLHSATHQILIDIYMKFCEDSLKGFQVIEWTQFCDKVPRGITKKYKCKSYGSCALHINWIDIYMKFHEDSLNSFLSLRAETIL